MRCSTNLYYCIYLEVGHQIDIWTYIFYVHIIISCCIFWLVPCQHNFYSFAVTYGSSWEIGPNRLFEPKENENIPKHGGSTICRRYEYLLSIYRGTFESRILHAH
jgi:hypothetical protein